VAALANLLWAQGKASNTLSAAGCLVHVLDGQGVSMAGFRTHDGLPPSGRELWEDLGRPSDVQWGDRVSCSIINRRCPHVYQPLNVKTLTLAGFEHLPFVLLRPSASAVLERIRCCYSFDVATMKLTCRNHGGDDECVPGCNADSRFIQRKARQAGFRGNGNRHWQDGSSPGGPHAGFATCLEEMEPEGCREGAGWCALAYNEVVLDSWQGGGWDKGAMVWAVGIDHGASDAAVLLAREVHAAAVGSALSIPLLWYDSAASATGGPFSVLEPAWGRV